jgi:hypothetical protein
LFRLLLCDSGSLVPRVKKLQPKWCDSSAVYELMPERVTRGAVPRILLANHSRQATSATQFGGDPVERLAIARAEDEGMPEPDTQPASRDTPARGQSGGMAKR